MKEQFTKFECDNCAEKTIIKDNSGFPYDKGWSYIYNINGQVSTNPTSKIQDAFKRFEAKDKHFCSKECALEYIRLELFGEELQSTRQRMIINSEKSISEPFESQKHSFDDIQGRFDDVQEPKKIPDNKNFEIDPPDRKKKRRRLF